MTSDSRAKGLGMKQVCRSRHFDMDDFVYCLLFVENKTRWTQHDSDTLLEVRIGDIQNWMDTLSKTLHDTEEEIDRVRDRILCNSCSICSLHKILHDLIPHNNYWNHLFIL